MNQFLKLLKPWEHTTKNLYICCSNNILRQALIQLKTHPKILNCNIIIDSNFNHYGIDSAKDINIIPIIQTNCSTQIYTQHQAYLANNIHNKDFLILQNNWNTPNLACISFLNTINNITSHLFNVFFTEFFKNITSTSINIYSNIIDDYYEQFINTILQLTIYYRNKLVKFNHKSNLPFNLKFQENDFLINRLQDINIDLNNCCFAQRINAQQLNANNVNITYFKIIENVSDIHNHDKFQYLTYLSNYFIDIPIYLN